MNELLVKSPKMSLRAEQSNPDVVHKLQFSKDRFVAPLLAMTCFSTFYELLMNRKDSCKLILNKYGKQQHDEDYT